EGGDGRESAPRRLSRRRENGYCAEGESAHRQLLVQAHRLLRRLRAGRPPARRHPRADRRARRRELRRGRGRARLPCHRGNGPETPRGREPGPAAPTGFGAGRSGSEEDAGSRQVRPGDVFFALPGVHTDGRRHIAEALGRGARAVITTGEVDAGGAPVVCVDAPERLLARAAAHLAGDPSAALTLVGVTGTNGKTTTTYLLEAIWRAAGRR